MNRAELVAAIGDRSGVPSFDPLRPIVGDRLNEALLEMSFANPSGWDWLVRDVDLALIEGTDVYPFEQIAPLVADNVALAAVNDLDFYPVTRIKTVADLSSNGVATEPIFRLSRAELDAGWQSGWTAENQSLVLSPGVSAGSVARLRVLIAERPLRDPLGGIEPEPLLPARYHPVLINLGRALVYEMKQDDDRALSARKLYDAGVRTAQSHSRPTGGPGRVPLQQV